MKNKIIEFGLVFICLVLGLYCISTKTEAIENKLRAETAEEEAKSAKEWAETVEIEARELMSRYRSNEANNE